MKQLLSIIITMLICSGCRKIESEKQPSPVEMKGDTVTENEDDIFTGLPYLAGNCGDTRNCLGCQYCGGM